MRIPIVHVGFNLVKHVSYGSLVLRQSVPDRRIFFIFISITENDDGNHFIYSPVDISCPNAVYDLIFELTINIVMLGLRTQNLLYSSGS